VALALVFSVVAMLMAPLAGASECPNEGVRGVEPFAGALPDCRAYEQVSPVEKNGQNALGMPGFVQSTSNGSAVSYVAAQPFAGSSGIAKLITNYMSVRESETWLTRSLDPPSEASPDASSFRGVTENLRFTVEEAEEPLAPGAAAEDHSSTYLRNNETGVYSVIAPAGGIFFSSATPDDSYMLFEHNGELLDHPGSSGNNVYEYHEGTLEAQNTVEGVAVPAVAGAGGPAAEGRGVRPEDGVYGGSHDTFYQQNTISSDGARVFFTDLENGQIYAREDGSSTVDVSKSQVAGEEPPVYWQAATPDGRYVFFLSEARLTAGATATSEHPDLYRYDFEKPEGERLTDLTTSVAEGAQVAGVLGVSEDGSYVYLVAGGVLAAGATQGEPNIYLWHENTVSFIATLASAPLLSEESEGTLTDALNWEQWRADEVGSDGDQGYKDSRVTPDGKTVLFTSTLHEGLPELYRYSAGAGDVACVSCNPSGKATTFPAELGAFMPFIALRAQSFKSTVPTRNLSASGDRVFFETSEALVSTDTNGLGGCPITIAAGEVHTCQDVYEWEADGAGSCQSTSQDGGCLFLISSGQSDAPSWFGNASVEGEDVFFFTGQSLVGQDVGEERDLYDARVDGGLTSQNPSSAQRACAGVQECRSAVPEAPVFSTPGSQTLTGGGNLVSTKGVVKQKGPAKCPKGKQRRHDKCVKVKHEKRRKGKHKDREVELNRRGKS
jgi:hypothetical protein